MPEAHEEFAPWLGVFETLRVVEGTPLFVAEHFEELQRAMQALGLSSDFNPAAARGDLQRANGRWRWIVTGGASRTLFTPEQPRSQEPIEIAISPVRVGSVNWDARFKTVSYLVHAQARRMAKTAEVIHMNEHGHVVSASGANMFWRRGDRLFTPAHEAGCRCGVVRGFVLAREKVEEGHFPVAELLAAEEIFLTNSMRGIVSVSRAEGKALATSEVAQRLRKAYDEEVARQVR
jgi:branched-chain amino acid aminotransferase/4-amino-4-deoxychorismate lyase